MAKRRTTISEPADSPDKLYPGDRVRAVWPYLGDRERLVLANVAERLLLGQKAYGELAKGKKPWRKEAAEEMLDGIVYMACELIDAKEEES